LSLLKAFARAGSGVSHIRDDGGRPDRLADELPVNPVHGDPGLATPVGNSETEARKLAVPELYAARGKGFELVDGWLGKLYFRHRGCY
jgi:hypothetical protein